MAAWVFVKEFTDFRGACATVFPAAIDGQDGGSRMQPRGAEKREHCTIMSKARASELRKKLIPMSQRLMA